MHVPDGFIDLPTSAATGVVAAGAVAFALRKAAPEIRESGPALPGLVWGLRLTVLLLSLHLAVAAAPYLGELRREAC